VPTPDDILTGWEMDDAGNWVCGDYTCKRIDPPPKPRPPGMRTRWQALFQGKPIARPSCIIRAQRAARNHYRESSS
jgi:hypothetical protein